MFRDKKQQKYSPKQISVLGCFLCVSGKGLNYNKYIDILHNNIKFDYAKKFDI